MLEKGNLTHIGRFGKTHGVKGEITLVTDFQLSENDANAYLVCKMDELLVPFFIEDSRSRSAHSILVKLERIDTTESIRPFINKEVYYPSEKLTDTPKEEDSSWQALKGFEVSARKLGKIGSLEDVDDSTLNVLMKVRYNGKEILLPLAEDLIESFDMEKREIHLNLPTGMLDL